MLAGANTVWGSYKYGMNGILLGAINSIYVEISAAVRMTSVNEWGNLEYFKWFSSIDR